MGTGIQTEMVITVEQAEEHFLGYLHAERSVSSETWRAYKNDLDQFRLHLQHKTGSKFLPVTEVTPDLVRSFMFALPKDLKSSSRPGNCRPFALFSTICWIVAGVLTTRPNAWPTLR